MKMVPPNTIVLKSSSLTENEYSQWSSATSYNKGDRVIYSHYIYEAINTNSNKRPDENSSLMDAPWKKVGATNRWAMFDDVLSTQSVAPDGVDDLVVEVDFSYADVVALINLVGETARIEVRDGQAAPYFTREIPLVRDTENFHEYFYSPITQLTDVTLTLSDLAATDIPVGMPGSVLKVTITKSGGGAACGHLVIGRAWDLGKTKIDATAGTKTYSVRETDEFGNLRIVPRRVVKRVKCVTYVDASKTDIVAKRLADIDVVPALFLADDRDTLAGGYESLIIYGTKTDHEFSIQPEGPHMDMLDISIEGVV